MNLCIRKLNCYGNICTNYKEIRVSNQGVYVGMFMLRYYYKNKEYVKKSSKLTTGQVGVVIVPEGSLQLTFTAYYYYTPIHTKMICCKTFDDAEDKCFLLVGTTLNPSCHEVPCSIGYNLHQYGYCYCCHHM